MHSRYYKHSKCKKYG